MSNAGFDSERPLVAHLLELRSRLLRGAAGLLLALLCLLPFANTLYALLAQPLLDNRVNLTLLRDIRAFRARFITTTA